jgi:hypothetical protein
MVNQTLKQEIIQLEADFCAALSDPTRIFILYALSEGPLNVTELTTSWASPNPPHPATSRSARTRAGIPNAGNGHHLSSGRPARDPGMDLLRSAMRDRLTQQANLSTNFQGECMKKRFPFWTMGLLGILLVILVPVLYFLPRAEASTLRPSLSAQKSLSTWTTRISSKANSKRDRT